MESDLFPGLRKVTIVSEFSAKKLLKWPLRNLEELHVENCDPNLDEEDFAILRRRLMSHGLKIMLDVSDYHWSEAEFAFWTTLDDETIVLDDTEEGYSDDDG
jgi:hypothetical protein